MVLNTALSTSGSESGGVTDLCARTGGDSCVDVKCSMSACTSLVNNESQLQGHG